EGPSAGSDRGSKRQRKGGEHASASSPSEIATGSAGRSTTGLQNQDFRYSDGFEYFQAIIIGRYEHVFDGVVSIPAWIFISNWELPAKRVKKNEQLKAEAKARGEVINSSVPKDSPWDPNIDSWLKALDAKTNGNDVTAEIFHDKKRYQSLALKAELRSMKLGDLSIDAYFRKFESIVVILKGLGSSLTDEDVVKFVLEGLPTKYDNV
nr:hybrid signal transduction histidine kinase M [Tanacetum cinerariifolium]